MNANLNTYIANTLLNYKEELFKYLQGNNNPCLSSNNTSVDLDPRVHITQTKCMNFYKLYISNALNAYLSASIWLVSQSFQSAYSNLGLPKFKFESAHVRYGIWTGPKWLQCLSMFHSFWCTHGSLLQNLLTISVSRSSGFWMSQCSDSFWIILLSFSLKFSRKQK